MDKKAYHHGDLRRALIETGLILIDQEGEDKLSLRKAAEKCGVSNAAPYAHFKNKDDFLCAIQDHIMKEFTHTLTEVLKRNENSPDVLLKLGKEYVLFFYKNPLYYDFLFSRKNIQIRLSPGSDSAGHNPPFELFQSVSMRVLQSSGMQEKDIRNKIIAMWGMVHGLAAIAIMPNVEFELDWEAEIEAVIASVGIL